MKKVKCIVGIILTVTITLIADGKPNTHFPQKEEIGEFYKKGTAIEIYNAIDSLFMIVNDSLTMIHSIDFLINSNASAEYAIDKWIDLILNKPDIFEDVYENLETNRKYFVDGIWEIASMEQINKLQNEFHNICSFFKNVNIQDDFYYDKTKAISYAKQTLSSNEVKFGNVIHNIGIKSKDCNNAQLNVVFISFTGIHKNTYVDITFEYKGKSFGEIIEYSKFNKMCPEAMVQMKREWTADSGCQ